MDKAGMLSRLLAAGFFVSVPCVATAQFQAEPLYSEVFDTSGKYRPAPMWHKVTTYQGCFVYFYSYRSGIFNRKEWPLHQVAWTGVCEPGRLASGSGFLSFDFRGGQPIRFRGTLQNGFLHGEIRKPTPTSTTPDEMHRMQFNMGCHVMDGQAAAFTEQCLKTLPFVQAAQGKPVVVSIEDRNNYRVVTWPSASAPQQQAQSQQQTQPQQQTKQQKQAQKSETKADRKVHNPAADAKSCVKPERVQKSRDAMRPTWRFKNNCNSVVELFWCVKLDGRCGSGGTQTVRVGGTWPVFDEGDLKWAACRGRDGGGMDRDSNGERYTCHLLKW